MRSFIKAGIEAHVEEIKASQARELALATFLSQQHKWK